MGGGSLKVSSEEYIAIKAPEGSLKQSSEQVHVAITAPEGYATELKTTKESKYSKSSEFTPKATFEQKTVKTSKGSVDFETNSIKISKTKSEKEPKLKDAKEEDKELYAMTGTFNTSSFNVSSFAFFDF